MCLIIAPLWPLDRILLFLSSISHLYNAYPLFTILQSKIFMMCRIPFNLATSTFSEIEIIKSSDLVMLLGILDSVTLSPCPDKRSCSLDSSKIFFYCKSCFQFVIYSSSNFFLAMINQFGSPNFPWRLNRLFAQLCLID